MFKEAKRKTIQVHYGRDTACGRDIAYMEYFTDAEMYKSPVYSIRCRNVTHMVS